MPGSLPYFRQLSLHSARPPHEPVNQHHDPARERQHKRYRHYHHAEHKQRRYREGELPRMERLVGAVVVDLGVFDGPAGDVRLLRSLADQGAVSAAASRQPCR